MEIACRQDVKQGPAYIAAIFPASWKDYAIEIQRWTIIPPYKNKSMVIKVTDPGALGADRRDCTGNERFAYHTGWEAEPGSDPCVCAGCQQGVREF